VTTPGKYPFGRNHKIYYHAMSEVEIGGVQYRAWLFRLDDNYRWTSFNDSNGRCYPYIIGPNKNATHKTVDSAIGAMSDEFGQSALITKNQ